MMPDSTGSLPEKPQHCSVHLCFKSSLREITVTKTSREATRQNHMPRQQCKPGLGQSSVLT